MAFELCGELDGVGFLMVESLIFRVLRRNRLLSCSFPKFAEVFAQDDGGFVMEADGFLGDEKCAIEVVFGFWVAFEVLEEESKGAVAVGEHFVIGA